MIEKSVMKKTEIVLVNYGSMEYHVPADPRALSPEYRPGDYKKLLGLCGASGWRMLLGQAESPEHGYNRDASEPLNLPFQPCTQCEILQNDPNCCN